MEQCLKCRKLNQWKKKKENVVIIGKRNIFGTGIESTYDRDNISGKTILELKLKVWLCLSHLEAVKQEMHDTIVQEVKQNVSTVQDKLTSLENNVKEVVSDVKTDDEESDGCNKNTCINYMGDSIVCGRRNALACGTKMAFNFYYGYLKLILPAENSTQGLKIRINSYIKDECLSDNAFPMKKLIILIPQNAYIPTSLNELSVDDPNDGSKYWIESVKPLKPETVERNGWKRDFHLPVYKIKDPDSTCSRGDYVVAEFATPLKVISDIIHNSLVPRISEAFKIYQYEIISSFHKSLLERISKNNDGCKDLCEVIYYRDTMNGKRVNVGRVILDKIHSRNSSCYQWK
ncbi:hypothetical protein L9F63_005027 [Diploptera punctata]|uniref:STING ligand-binding domain-containing protein n=1 Tax=Diploptera punctata TaxID=6984 RepID=A0AAD7ZF20_DIPPU|nr:hypothetical protein L9F63_005027 [Diploptera punctata]